MLQAAACASAATCHAPQLLHKLMQGCLTMQIYYVGLLAGANDFDAVEEQGPRGINRQVQERLHSLSLRPSLKDVGTSRLQHQVPACCRLLTLLLPEFSGAVKISAPPQKVLRGH